MAERLLTRHVPHTDIEDLMRWCMTVARNSAIDQHRRLRRSVPLDGCADDAVDGSELVDTVEARMRLDRVLRVLGTMPYEDVRCVMASLDGETSAEAASPALRARRHRIRRRLSELVGCFGLVGVVLRALRPRAGRTLGLSSAAVASVALVTVVAGPPGFGFGPDHVRLHLAPATVRAQQVDDGVPVVRRASTPGARAAHAAPAGAGTMRPAASPGLHVRTPNKTGTIDVRGHDRTPADRGIVCVTGLKYVADICVGSTVTTPVVPPAR